MWLYNPSQKGLPFGNPLNYALLIEHYALFHNLHRIPFNIHKIEFKIQFIVNDSLILLFTATRIKSLSNPILLNAKRRLPKSLKLAPK